MTGSHKAEGSILAMLDVAAVGEVPAVVPPSTRQAPLLLGQQVA